MIRTTPIRLRCISLLLGIFQAGFASAGTPPAVVIPRSATPFSVGEEIILNGIPMQIHGFISAEALPLVAHWYRERLGQPLVENRIDNALILGKAYGDHFMTVRLEPAGAKTKGTVSLTDFKAVRDRDTDNAAQYERIKNQLPTGSRLLSHMSSVDAGRRSQHLIFTNDASEQTNRNALADRLKAQGLKLEREIQASDAASNSSVEGRVLYFKGNAQEVTATISTDSSGRTVAVINTVSTVKGRGQ